MSTAASLAEIRDAVDAAVAYLGYAAGPRVDVLEAVDVACDRGRVVGDRDRRIVRKAVERRLEHQGARARRLSA